MSNFKKFYYLVQWNFFSKAIEFVYWDKDSHCYITKEIYRCKSLPVTSKIFDFKSEEKATKVIKSIYNFLYPDDGKLPPFQKNDVLNAANQFFYWEFLGRWQIGPKLVEYLKSNRAGNLIFVSDAMWAVYCSITNYNFSKEQFNFYIEDNGSFEMRLHSCSCEKFPFNKNDFDNPLITWVQIAEHNTDKGMANELAFLAGIAVLSSLAMKKIVLYPEKTP
ncbi:hypothetical protein IPN41_02390 [Candidatus Falkowbacteria bacterium]|nr:MAG: hypothetical protein IPN41_02390 [Candidatus Falkowbacteria bacterium]